ncbi:rubrerythrin-like domain-containing protein [Natribaculum luteum]|uniref:Rubrerythrin-like domain-containing protein n=1 Tax=Natribaculum luteum TaxID=1586232 RepID=A0ABD5NUS7_9EURY|nr:rubrerythrin-like domain-containing protein [Natribaculum luteum]
MGDAVRLEYECVRCGFRQTPDDALVSTCPRCGGEMHNVVPIDS